MREIDEYTKDIFGNVIAEPVDELTHGVVFPVESGEVLFWCANRYHSLNPTLPILDAPTFIWNPGEPDRATLIVAPTDTGFGDLFCNGHALDSNGNVVAVGGTNIQVAENEAHKRVYRFDRATMSWSRVQDILHHRWYPYVVPEASGKCLILGHAETSGPLGELPTRFRGHFDPATGLSTHWENHYKPNTTVFPFCGLVDAEVTQKVGAYPRVHLLAKSHRLFYRPDHFAAGENVNEAHYLQYDIACTNDPELWTTIAPPNGRKHFEGNSVHYVWYDAVGAVHDNIYAIGGGSDHANSTAIVDKITNPTDAGSAWVNSPNGVPALNTPRMFGNTVVLNDGSIAHFGGLNQSSGTGGIHDFVHCVELYKPPEVFGAAASSAWEVLVGQLRDRDYHSIAGPLPDGRVFSAGGQELPELAPKGSKHSIELFSPPFLFQGRAPEITSTQTTEWTYNQQYNVTVSVRAGQSPVRVHLLRGGSATHAFDATQRYVQLRKGSPTETTPGNWILQVQAPAAPNHAPPGYYMFVVVDSSGVPSKAKFIRVAASP
jgi:Domain of unknown function (DUF1929)